jgi:hypothetical protein
VVALDITKLPRLRALESELRRCVRRGDDERASRCADLILDLLGLRPFELGETI